MRATWVFAAAMLLATLSAGPAHAAVPGEDAAVRIENIYYQQGPQKALEALAQDYKAAWSGPNPEAGRQQINDEVSRLEAHTARYLQYSPLAAIATEWCLERHGLSDFPLRYSELLPAADASPGASLPDVELDREMVKVLQINWIDYANLTRSQTRGYVADVQQTTIATRADLLKDQSEQEEVRTAANSLSGKR
ncbi:MAG: hypothetical protein ACLPKB_11595 [Xanthobacteraceae bacterium]